MNQTIDQQLYEIAEKHLFSLEGRGDLIPRMSDDKDFIDVYVVALDKLLKEVYELGKANGKKQS